MGSLWLHLALLCQLGLSLDISHWDLQGANRTCGGKSSCVREKGSRRGDELDWRERNCFCDHLCSLYGDCCPDSEHYRLLEQRRGAASFSCVELRQFGGVYMRDSCPPEWGDGEVRAACEMASSEDRLAADPLLGLPATSQDSGVTYRNLFCARCHGETDLDAWHPRIECTSLRYHNLTKDQVYSSLQFNSTAGAWGILVETRFYPCNIDPVLPDASSHLVRKCVANLQRSCAINWTNTEVRTRCEGYTSVVYSFSESYRNPHCAICNSVSVQELQCNEQPIVHSRFGGKDFNPAAFSVLFDLSGDPLVGKVQPCADSELYDPFFKKCRAILRELDLLKRSYYNSSSPEPGRANGSLPCSWLLLEKGSFQVLNDSVFVEAYGRSFEDGWQLREDGTLELCAPGIGLRYIDKFGPHMGYLTFAGLGVSIIFLLLHLTAFCLVPDLRNLSGKNLASFCFALLTAFSFFMTGQLVQGLPCLVVAVLTYYFFLAAFFWMLTMSFDVWRTLRLATSELRVSSGKQWRKFTVYSLWSWVAPAVIVAGAVFVDTAPEDALSTEWRPQFGVDLCWFGQKRPLWLFFGAPATVIMGLNILFFGSSAHMIYSTSSTTRFTASAGTQRDFRLYGRLAVLMGLTWAVGVVAGSLDLPVLWYLFILLNTLQGLFVFLCFTCTDKVIRGLAQRRAEDKPLRPPSFSWSTDSTRKSEQGTQDTLY